MAEFIGCLRPDHWLTEQAATVGGTVYISVPECGIDGNAKVLAIKACPPIAANPGPGFQIVTGTFQHQAAKILDIGVESESKPIGTTPNHPIWSADREAFVRADSLTVGERLQTLSGVTTVTSITARGPPEPVYNLEVQVKHTYYVADTGVLVHNGKGCVNINKNSRDYKGESHVYAIRSPDGSVYKIGKSSTGKRIRDGVSKRAEAQVRKLNRQNIANGGMGGFTSEIRKDGLSSSGAALDYEKQVRDLVSTSFWR